MKIKSIFILVAIIMLTGCPGAGDRLVFDKKGDAIINAGSICIKRFPGDQLDYYMLSSSENNYHEPLARNVDGESQNLNGCLPLKLKKNTHYELIYILNQKHYRVEFNTDDHLNIEETFF